LTASKDDLRVIDNPDDQRYEARLGDQVVGFSQYRLVSGRIILFHTEVDPAFEGRGIGGRLAAGALEHALSHGWRVTVKCPFIGAYLQRHPELAARLNG
jgi:predicted GNAT family acetyltransferase